MIEDHMSSGMLYARKRDSILKALSPKKKLKQLMTKWAHEDPKSVSPER